MLSAQARTRPAHRVIDTDMAAILYTSGSTGQTQGRRAVTSQHGGRREERRRSISRIGPQDRILAALPLSFDAGFSQLTTAFHAGASVTLHQLPVPRDVVTAVERRCASPGLPRCRRLWIQLAQLKWPERGTRQPALHRQYRRTHAEGDARRAARAHCPARWLYLMYGLTEVVPLHLSAALGARSAARFDRQGDPERRGAGRAPGRHALRCRTSPASWCIAARWCRSAIGTTRRRPRSASGPLPGQETGLVDARDRRVVRRHRAPGRRGIPLLHRPARRNDQDLRLPREPHRSRGGGLRHRPGRRSRRLGHRASGARAGHRRSWPRRPRIPCSTPQRCSRSAASAFPPSWSRRASSSARAACRATRTARSIASCWRRNSRACSRPAA